MAQHFTGWQLKENQIFQGDIHGETWSFKCSCFKQQQQKHQEQNQEVNLPVEMVQALHSLCLDVGCSRLGLKWTRPAQSFFPCWSIARYDWSDLVNNIVFVIGVLSCRAKTRGWPWERGFLRATDEASEGLILRIAKVSVLRSSGGVRRGGIHAPYTHSKRDHSADPSIISTKSITTSFLFRLVQITQMRSTHFFTLRLNSSTTCWLCFPGLA